MFSFVPSPVMRTVLLAFPRRTIDSTKMNRDITREPEVILYKVNIKIVTKHMMVVILTSYDVSGDPLGSLFLLVYKYNVAFSPSPRV